MSEKDFSTALAVRDTAINPAGMGDKYAIAAIRDRIMTMMPGALDAPADVVWAAAQLAVAYQLDPFNGEIYIMKIGRKQVGEQWVDEYRAHIGIKGLRKKAREQARFMTRFRDMTAEEVKVARRVDYDPADIGVVCEVYRMDIVHDCKYAGIPYEPFRATGFWRVNANFIKKTSKWEPDNIPSTWTAHDVAEKRAEINALKRAYDLTINVADPSVVKDDEAIEVIGRKVEEIEMHRQPVHRTEIQREPDGDALWDADATTDYRTVDMETGEIFADGSAEDTAPEPLDILTDASVHDAVKGFVESLRKLEVPGARHASPKQHNYAVGIIDAITGKDSHRAVLSAIFYRDVTKDTSIAEASAQQIFKKLCETKTVGRDENNKPIKGENPDYDPQDVIMLGEVSKWAVKQGVAG